MHRYAEILVLASTATLFFRKEIFYLFKPFEIGIAAALFCILVYALRHKENILKGTPDLGLWSTLFGLMLFWSALGAVNAYRIYGIADPVKMVGGFFYLGVGMTAFLLILYYGQNVRFRKLMYVCLLSPLVVAPLLLIPAHAEAWGFLGDRIHFFGFHKNPTTFAFLAALACIILIGKCLRADRIRKKIIPWIGVVLLLSLCLWTGSRASWLALALAYAYMALLTFRSATANHTLPSKIRQLTLLFAGAALTLSVAFTILPHRTKLMALDRIYPQISSYFPDADFLDRAPLGTTLNLILRSSPSLPYQSRQSLWPQALTLFVQHPLGLGPEYFRSAKEILQNDYPTHSHNTILQILLTGGIGLLITCIFFLWVIAKKISYAKHDNEWLILSGMLIASAVFLMIGEYFYIAPWTWIVAALTAAKGSKMD